MTAVNKFRGEVQTSTGHMLVLDYNALANLEQLTGRNAIEVTEEIDQGTASFTDRRFAFLACLLRHYPQMTVIEAGDIASEDPGALNRAAEAAAPDASQVAENSSTKSRQKKAG